MTSAPCPSSEAAVCPGGLSRRMALSRWLGHALIWSFGGFPEPEAKGCTGSSDRQEYAF